VPLHEGGDIKLRLLEDLDLTDVAILDRKDTASFSCDLLTNWCGNELLDQGLEVALGSQFGHSSNHLCSDGTTLCGLGVASALDLVLLSFCEGNAKDADDVTIGSTAVNVTLNDGLLLTDQTAKLIAGHVHSVEVEEAVVSLNILNAELNFAIGKSLILVQVSKRHLEHTTLEAIGSILGTHGLSDESLSGILHGKDGRSDKVVPFLLKKRVKGLLTGTLLALCQALVLSLLVERAVQGLAQCLSSKSV
jgi:hypothetical protein